MLAARLPNPLTRAKNVGSEIANTADAIGVRFMFKRRHDLDDHFSAMPTH